MTPITHHFIGGERVASLGSRTFFVRSPYDGRLIGTVAAATDRDVDVAVASARRAFDEGSWPHMTPAERHDVLARFAVLHAARATDYAKFISDENGSPMWFTSAVQQGVAPQNAAYLQAAATYPWESEQSALPQGKTLWRRAAVGVVAAIIPWNAPHQSALVKLFPALLAGCTVILKLAPETGLDGHLLGELFAEAGLPKGVVNILTADREVSEYLVGHPGVDKIAFTGSTAAGRRIAAVAGDSLKRVSLELGGKSAAIVLPDANFAATMATLRYASFANTGQSCVAQTRVLVPKDQQDRFVDGMVELVRAMSIGDPADPEMFIGPLVSFRQQERVWDYIQSGLTEGATLATGGMGMPPGIKHGSFVQPTIFRNVDNRMRVAQEEIFGPVLCVIPYEGLEDAIRQANDSPFGLGGSVWTADAALGLNVARKIRTGTFSVNGRGPDFLAPFGGFKKSGIGREFGEAGISQFVEHQAIYV